MEQCESCGYYVEKTNHFKYPDGKYENICDDCYEEQIEDNEREYED